MGESHTEAALGRLTYEEFLDRADEGARLEWVDGEVVELSPAPDWHQLLGGFLNSLLQVWVEERTGGKVIPPPFQMKTAPGLPGREPDLLYVAPDHLDRLKTNHLDGPADLVVEVISPKSRARPRRQVLRV